ncbi:DNA adenine methylase [Candidatus Chrysopegis kryptomonas]|uniref:Adenine-specific DNA-methyltransferase n=1 Tax=Candidatus Chryseopegocella kryptomonas TaxID=1633643 RepID=A0A0P1MSF0_9BACT|nr:DNA adenine methylase [Candidatus Chrysopegis kryptomonas]CUS98652.1 adenine-specific DNA-methyltransferase [Candidatus Chrysopegis kryptomonas]
MLNFELNRTLFGEVDFDRIRTEGIKYIGSKEKIIPYILRVIYRLKPKVVFDGFSGTTRVSQALAKMGYKVISNDIAVWSKTFATCYLLNKKDKGYYQEMINYLNNLPPKFGWFSKHYGGDPSKGEAKKPWQIHNTMKLDAIREEIDKIAVDEVEKSVLLTSLILALDKVDNTIGHFSAYLKDWAPRSYKEMVLKVPSLIITDAEHEVYQEDIFNLLPFIEADVAYYDPPYGSNNDKMPPSRVRYQAYYHIWTTIIKNDKPKLFGSALRRWDSSDKISYSPFEDFRKNESGKFIALEAIEKLISETKAKYIVFSYSSMGRVPFQELVETFAKYAKILEIQKINYKKNVMTYMRWTNEWIKEKDEPNIEYLFLLKK